MKTKTMKEIRKWLEENGWTIEKHSESKMILVDPTGRRGKPVSRPRLRRGMQKIMAMPNPYKKLSVEVIDE